MVEPLVRKIRPELKYQFGSGLLQSVLVAEGFVLKFDFDSSAEIDVFGTWRVTYVVGTADDIAEVRLLESSAGYCQVESVFLSCFGVFLLTPRRCINPVIRFC